MADDKPSPAIPAWQRAQPPSPKQTDEGGKIESTEHPATTDSPHAIGSGLPARATPVAVLAGEELTSTNATSASQLENMKTFLEDPAVKAASVEKKRAFFESKGIAAELIDQVLKDEEPAFSTGDFVSFKKIEEQAVLLASQPQPPVQQTQAAPPIITYPEFLVEAHKPTPLITPSRIVNTAYFAASIYAVIYGASKYLVTPMALSLADARHDFAQHSQTKLDEMNERLVKLVTKLPEKKVHAIDSDADTDGSSETSDPTELYHRDMGTQTSPPPSPPPSSTYSSFAGHESSTEKKKDYLTHSTNTLSILQSHLSEMLGRAEGLEQPNKDRQASMDKLRTYLENLMYASSSYGMWDPLPEGAEKKEKESEDVIEEVKKEIRGVKGVLLSAKRFPGVAARIGG